ncbi:MAG TPA: hypothetical protein VLA78_05295, partial [Paracoccaceae bacterium]|nr:hypothetical protein [Paracoccaceae bacterium]
APLDLTAPGHPEDGPRDWIRGPWQDRLTLAGSETSATHAGYLAGAAAAAERAAAQVLARLARGAAPG